jgi:hypothetical protein
VGLRRATQRWHPPEEVGFDAYGNLVAEPEYADPQAGDFELGARSPCRTVLDKQTNEAARSEG